MLSTGGNTPSTSPHKLWLEDTYITGSIQFSHPTRNVKSETNLKMPSMAIQWNYYPYLSGHLPFTNAAPLQKFFQLFNYIILGAGQSKQSQNPELHVVCLFKAQIKVHFLPSFTKLYVGSYIYP